jgi:hypothetical protein
MLDIVAIVALQQGKIPERAPRRLLIIGISAGHVWDQIGIK